MFIYQWTQERVMQAGQKSYAEKNCQKLLIILLRPSKSKKVFLWCVVIVLSPINMLFCLYFGVLSVLNWLFFFIFFKCTETQEEWKMFVALKIHLLLSKQGLHKLSKKLCTKRLSKTFNHTFETMKSKRRIFLCHNCLDTRSNF